MKEGVARQYRTEVLWAERSAPWGRRWMGVKQLGPMSC